jgi:hypothetical protein
MFRTSRLLVLSLAILFFFAGAVAAYGRCLEGRKTLGTDSEVVEAEEGKSHADSHYSHCPEHLTYYVLAQVKISARTDISSQLSFEDKRVRNSGAGYHWFSTRAPPREFPGRFLPSSVPVYQSKVVYLI